MARRTILIADSSPTTVLWARIVLEAHEYDVISALDGYEALQRVRDDHPDLAILDVALPLLSGFAACREIRALEDGRTLPIIMLSTSSDSALVLEAFQSGCNEYLLKPASVSELSARVRSLLPPPPPPSTSASRLP
jgi:DNA-binding response OmpR family regulator